jgi:hypothetical protein
MKLVNPTQVRQLFAAKKGWLTIEEIAAGLKMSTRTVSKAFSGRPLRANTVRRFAEPLEEKPTNIASFLN